MSLSLFCSLPLSLFPSSRNQYFFWVKEGGGGLNPTRLSHPPTHPPWRWVSPCVKWVSSGVVALLAFFLSYNTNINTTTKQTNEKQNKNKIIITNNWRHQHH